MTDTLTRVDKTRGLPPISARTHGPRTHVGRGLLVLYVVSIATAAALVFSIQPLVVKRLLPIYGGSAATWNVAMVFFQSALLAGYAYAHFASSKLRPRTMFALHAVVIIAAGIVLSTLRFAVPGFGSSWPPALRLLSQLVVMVGAPYLVVASASPLIQRWFAALPGAETRNPYPLYAASNVGSLLGLLAVPFVLEPFLHLDAQGLLWIGIFWIFVILCLMAARPAASRSAAPKQDAGGLVAIPVMRYLQWMGLAAIPVALLLVITHRISTDLAAVPLLWVVPLAAYLLSFIIAFGLSDEKSPRAVRLSALGFAASASLAALGTAGVMPLPIWAEVAVQVAVLLSASVMLHTRLVMDRPPAQQLTAFYLSMSAGGALGGIAVALMAPVLLPDTWEYVLVMAAALLLRPRLAPHRRIGPVSRDFLAFMGAVTTLVVAIAVVASGVSPVAGLGVGLLTAGVLTAVGRWPAVLAILLVGLLAAPYVTTEGVLLRERTFFGAYEVLDVDGQHQLVHGNTMHGTQFQDERSSEPTTYYSRSGPIGDVFASFGPDGPSRVGAVGLGTGTLAAYGQSHQAWTFWEIDQGIVDIASDPRHFSYLSDSPARTDLVVVDGRIGVQDAKGANLDLLVLDAFSSDSVPVHLLTREALSIYADALSPDGLIAVHVSNRYLDLAPVVAATADDLDFHSRVRTDSGFSEFGNPSQWVILGSEESVNGPVFNQEWTDVAGADEAAVWTDGHAAILDALHWGNSTTSAPREN